LATFTWNTGSGDFGTAGNWAPSGPPLITDTALFSAGSGTISGVGTVNQLNMSAGGPWAFTASIAANFYTVNDATTLVGPGLWTLTGSAATGNYLIIANGANTTGALTVSGGGTINSTQTPTTAAYALYVGGGSTATSANGTLLVTGAGSSVNTGVNGAAVGETGVGTLTVTAGAAASFASSNSAIISALAVGRAGNGTVSVTGGSTLTAAGFVYIGRQGTGTLNVDGASTMTGGSAASGSASAYSIAIGDGTPTLDSNGNPNSPLYFGGSGAATVTNGSTLHSLASLRVGYRGTAGTLLVDTNSTATADGQVLVGAGTDRAGGTGTVTVQGGGALRSGTAQVNGNAGIVLGSDASTTGTVTVSGSTSTLDANGFRLTVGSNGSGSLTIAGGAKALSGASYTDVEAAFAVAGGTGATGTVSITGAGSQLTASGDAVIGGNEKGAGATAGGTGTVSVTNGGRLAVSGTLTIEAAGKVIIDRSATLSAPQLTINGGLADIYTLASGTAVTFGAGGTLKVHAVNGVNTISGFGFGDQVDFAGTTAVSLSGNTVTTATGSVRLATTPANASYQLVSDGAGGLSVAIEPQTIGVYRFFDTKFGTHFYTSDSNEAATIRASRSDLIPEGPGGVGLQADAVAASDPNAAAVYRFFDTLHGTHFFTASASERDSLIAGRADLKYEASSTFYEHIAQQPGDIPVYRFFDKTYGTHFYTDSASEFAAVQSARADLVYEGVGFYEPPQNYAKAT